MAAGRIGGRCHHAVLRMASTRLHMRFQMMVVWLLLVFFMVGLPGCAVLPEVTDDPAIAEAEFGARAARLAAVSHWRFVGRLTLELPSESWSGQLNWRTDGTGQVIDLSGPMGRGGGRLILGGVQALLITRDGQRFEADDPDALTRLITGRDLPVNGLSYWVRGMARPGVPFDLRADGDGQPRRLIQDGWEIAYGVFDDADPVAMPMSAELRREDMRLHLLVDRWQLTPANLP